MCEGEDGILWDLPVQQVEQKEAQSLLLNETLQLCNTSFRACILGCPTLRCHIVVGLTLTKIELTLGNKAVQHTKSNLGTRVGQVEMKTHKIHQFQQHHQVTPHE